eukprot:scaffold12393_cov105-Isochrysis_galbana.AAC.1
MAASSARPAGPTRDGRKSPRPSDRVRAALTDSLRRNPTPANPPPPTARAAARPSAAAALPPPA